MKSEFRHVALDLQEERPIIFTALSKHLFYFRMFICTYVLEQGGVPVNPFMVFDYFLLDTIDRDLVRRGNNNLIKKADELWVFGPISDGVLAEIKQSKALNKPIKYFRVEKSRTIAPITHVDDIEMEDEVAEFRKEL